MRSLDSASLRSVTRSVGATAFTRTRGVTFAALSALSLSALALGGCATPQTAPTTITAADVAGSSSNPAPATVMTETAPTPATTDAADATAADTEEAPAGKLVCRTKTLVDGTSELYLEWHGEEATGFIRRVVPSGMTYVQPVRAERAKNMIVADVPSNTDLAAHSAIVVTQNGKQHMRLGEAEQRWTACE